MTVAIEEATAPTRPATHAVGAKAGWLVKLSVLLIVILWTIPSLGLFVGSLLPASVASSTGWWTALFQPFNTEWTLNNYSNVLERGMFQAFVNSLIITIPSTVIPITLAAFAAYAFAWVKFRGRAFLFAVVVGLLVVPLQMSLVPMLRIYQATGLTGSFLGIWLAHTGFGLPLAIYLLYNYISQLPKDIFESAYLDGATPFTAFTRLVLPLSLPALASFAIFQFLWVWNDLLVALVFLGTTEDVAPVTIQVATLAGTRGESIHLLTAAAFISMILPMVVFLLLQRFFVRGLLAGSVKG